MRSRDARLQLRGRRRARGRQGRKDRDLDGRRIAQVRCPGHRAARLHDGNRRHHGCRRRGRMGLSEEGLAHGVPPERQHDRLRHRPMRRLRDALEAARRDGRRRGHVQEQRSVDRQLRSHESRASARRPTSSCCCSYPPGGAVAVKQLRDAGINSAIFSNGAMDGTYWFKNSIPKLSNFCCTTWRRSSGTTRTPRSTPSIAAGRRRTATGRRQRGRSSAIRPCRRSPTR